MKPISIPFDVLALFAPGKSAKPDRLCAARSVFCATVAVLAATPLAVAPLGGAWAATAGVALVAGEREIKAAGITTTRVEKERGNIELVLPGTVVIPPQQLRVVAAPANGMVEAVLVAADEPVAAGQPIASLRSPDLVEAQRQYLAALADESLAQDRLRRAQYLFEGRATPERELRVVETEAVNAKSRLDERTADPAADGHVGGRH